MCKYELPTPRLSKVDRLTDRIDRNYKTCHFVGGPKYLEQIN